MEFYVVLNQVLILFLILIIGFVAGKFKIIDSTGTKILSELLLSVASPMLVFNSFFIEFSSEKLINILWIIGAGGGMFLISILLGNLMYKGFDEKIKPVIIFTAIFSNCGYMGLPLLKALFGEEGVFYGSFYIVLFNIALWSYGFILFGGKGTKAQIISKVLVKPALIAVYIGMIIFVTGIPVPSVIKDATKYVGDMTLPLSMLIIGGVISTIKFNTVFSDWRVYLSSAVRLILMPLISIAFSRLIGAPALIASVVAIALAMPTAASTTMFSEMFDKNTVFASKCVTVSTLISIATIPLLVYFAIK